MYIDAWNPFQDCFVRTLRDGGLVRVRIDLFSAHVLSEFVVDMTPTTNGATGTDRDAERSKMFKKLIYPYLYKGSFHSCA